MTLIHDQGESPYLQRATDPQEAEALPSLSFGEVRGRKTAELAHLHHLEEECVQAGIEVQELTDDAELRTRALGVEPEEIRKKSPGLKEYW